MFKCKKKITPPIFHNLLMPKLENNYNIRKLTEPFYRKKVPILKSWSTLIE